MKNQRNGAAVDFVTELQRLRAEIAAIDEEIVTTTNARVTREEAIARIDAVIASAGTWKWPAKANEFAFAHPPTNPRARILPNAAAPTWELLDWILATFPDVIRERLLAGLPDDPGISAAERTRRLADLAAQRLDLERREERLILEAERARIALDRRGDLSPSVYLETTLADVV